MVSFEIEVNEEKLSSVLEALKNNNVKIKSEYLKKDPYYFQRRAYLHKLLEDIESGKEPLYDFNEEIDKLIEKYNDADN
jgi:hypothetical protein